MRTSRSGTLWLAVIVVLLLAVGAQAQQAGVSVSSQVGVVSQPSGMVVVQAPPGSTVTVQPAPGTVSVAPGAVIVPQGAMITASPELNHYARLWSSRPQQTITGEIVRVGRYYPAGASMGPGTEIVLSTAMPFSEMVPDWQRQMMPTEFVTVQLGPEWAVNQSLPGLRIGQELTVTGKPVRYHGMTVLLAESVQRGGTQVAFRSLTGMPLWAGGWQAWQFGTPAGVAFNPVAIQTMNGVVQSISTAQFAPGMGFDQVAMVQAPNGQIFQVDLAPSTFLQQSGLMLQVGQPIAVTGSLVNINGQPTIIASSVQYGGQQFALRSNVGVPMWTITTAAAAPPVVVAQGQVTTATPGVIQTVPPVTGPVAGTQVTPGEPTSGPQPNSGTQSY